MFRVRTGRGVDFVIGVCYVSGSWHGIFYSVMPPWLQTDRLFALPEAWQRFTLDLSMPDHSTTHYDRLIQELRTRGFRITTPRCWTLRVLSEQSGHMTSEQVYQRLHEHDIQVDEATVYRTLQWLADNRIVTRTNL